MKPIRASVFLLLDENNIPKGIIVDDRTYKLDNPLRGEELAELHNGGILPLVQDALGKEI